MSNETTQDRLLEQAQKTNPIVLNIYKGEISPEDKTLIEQKRAYYASVEGDAGVFDSITFLREQVEPMEKWKETAEKAAGELTSLPPDIIEQLLVKFAPFIKSMPAGHSRGHFLRDSASFTALMQDPNMQQYRKVEVIAGLFAGLFHDIGTAVVSRYDDSIRFSGHAEVGAYVFADVSKDLLPPNISKLAQLGIAAHTHYLKDLTVTRNVETGKTLTGDVVVKDTTTGEIIQHDGEGIVEIHDRKTGNTESMPVQRKTRKQYNNHVEDGHKIAMWYAQWSDRLDTRGPFHAVRHILTKAVPTMDFTGEEFHEISDDEMADFKQQFASYREKPNVLWSLMLFADSDFKNPPVYNLHDTEFMTKELFGPEDRRQLDFVESVEDIRINKLASMTEEEKKALTKDAFEKFYDLCRLLEPASDTEKRIELLKRQFALLAQDPTTEDVASHWAIGFKELVDKIYPESYHAKQEMLDVIPSGIKNLGPNLHATAQEVWKLFDPALIKPHSQT